ncbi:MAG: 4-alpha-glucanotransferase, partial [Deferribacteraceae bacterium]|nr:4-alpha-glucanotransferase [Deferribacteraceae bacterium]
MKFPLLIGLHCHQPVHNFHNVVDEAAELSYTPFLKYAERYPNFRFVVHYSGWLLEYLCKNHKDTFNLLKKLSDRGQVEFFGGGYYEPVLSAIPSDDRRGQIDKLSALVKDKFGRTPTGLWLTERVWDPAILPDLVSCGIEDVIVDDYHFIAAGFNESSLTGYFRTEQDGLAVNIFPIDQGLRYRIPFTPAKDVMTYLKEMETAGRKMLVCFDDGEKFGLWPDTYKWVYGDPDSKDAAKRRGWLEDFMETVSTSEDVSMGHFADLKK